MKKHFKYYFLLGIGGIGMSAIARYLKYFGLSVIGYDAQMTKLTKQLEQEGISVFYKDDAELIPQSIKPDNTLVIRTPAIKSGNLLNYFLQNKFNVLKRAEFLAQIANDNRQIAIAGTHGKTTTTAILSHILKLNGSLKAGFVGGITKNYGSNLILGNGDFVAIEADEYDKAFLLLKPEIAVVTSIEADHLDIYENEHNLRESFAQFVQNTKADGKIIVNQKAKLNIKRQFYTYGTDAENDFFAENVRYFEQKQIFRLHLMGKTVETFITLPGQAYLENAIAASAAAFLAGVPTHTIAQGLQTYKGTERRFDLRFAKYGKFIYDDYAHHPTEIKALYQAARLFHPQQKLTIVFQPHLYSRTRDFAPQFGEALSNFDLVIVTDIYPAREEPIEGVSPQLILDYVDNPNKIYIPKSDLTDFLLRTDFNVLLVTGAGDINLIIEPLTQKLLQLYENQ